MRSRVRVDLLSCLTVDACPADALAELDRERVLIGRLFTAAILPPGRAAWLRLRFSLAINDARDVPTRGVPFGHSQGHSQEYALRPQRKTRAANDGSQTSSQGAGYNICARNKPFRCQAIFSAVAARINVRKNCIRPVDSDRLQLRFDACRRSVQRTSAAMRERSRHIATMPAIGPMAMSASNAGQPNLSAKSGAVCTVMTVSANPRAV